MSHKGQAWVSLLSNRNLYQTFFQSQMYSVTPMNMQSFLYLVECMFLCYNLMFTPILRVEFSKRYVPLLGK